MLVLSGINYGYNSIALSEGACECHEVTDAYLPGILERLLEKKPGPGQIWNVNFPGCPLSECKGILKDRPVSRGTFYRDRYKELKKLPDGGIRLMVDGQYNEDAEEGTDFRAIVDKYVSIGTVNNIG